VNKIKPYRAAGAAMAIEDAAVLGNIFARMTTKEQVLPFLRAYESIRLERANTFQRASRDNRHVYHYPDGPQQQERDRYLVERNPGSVRKTAAMSDGDFNQFAFSYDADKEVDKYWERFKDWVWKECI
jgi:salicylate hydroxylase